MHFSVVIYLKEKEEYENQVNDILESFKEHYDWFQIGGRWSGNLGNSNPEDNPDNWETCSICNGTGMRNDELGKETRKENPAYTCNGCSTIDSNGNMVYQDPKHPGQRMKWPTQWEPAEDDIIPVSNLNPKADWYAMVVEYDWIEKEFWNPNTEKYEPIMKHAGKTIKEILDMYKITDGFLVQIDCHN
jgi:hypothetical protein